MFSSKVIYSPMLIILLAAIPLFLVSADQTVDSLNHQTEVADSVLQVESADSVEYVRSAHKFFAADYARFRYDQETVLLEMYTLVDRSMLGVEEVADGFQAQYKVTFKLYEDDSLLVGDSWIRNDLTASETDRMSGQKIPELIKYRVKPGSYTANVVIVDLVKNSYQSEGFLLELDAFSNDKAAISDIMFASKIDDSAEDLGEFGHNGLLVLPNAERTFGISNPRVFYYTEIYNLSLSEGSEYTVTREILNDSREVVRTLKQKQRAVPGENVVEVDAFNVATLPTGSYALQITVEDLSTGDSVSRERRFWVYRAGELIASRNINDPGFDIAAMSDEAIEKELKMIRYVMPNKLQSQIKELNDDAQRQFLANFWIANDPEKETKANEWRQEYMRRVAEANERFGSFKKEGWTTDRGRVYLINGQPDNIEYHPFDSQYNKAFQIWYYDGIEGGVQYVFVDRNGYGDYIQVHSTKSGEISNSEWRTLEKLGRF
ncbi:GWxTD domain-containing protein [bacterium]|nr:GWxTD domain-containing protein [bacterium]